MWSVLGAGYGSEATLIGEPTGLALVHAGTGVVWARRWARGQAGHSAFGGGEGPFEELARAVAALRAVEAEAKRAMPDPVFAAVSGWPYGMTVGRIGGRVWTSSRPGRPRGAVRVRLRARARAGDVQARIVEAVRGRRSRGGGLVRGVSRSRLRPRHGGPVPGAPARDPRAPSRRGGEALGVHGNDRRAPGRGSALLRPQAGSSTAPEEWVGARLARARLRLVVADTTAALARAHRARAPSASAAPRELVGRDREQDQAALHDLLVGRVDVERSKPYR